MIKVMDSKWGKRIEDAVAFRINFHSLVYGYGDRGLDDYYTYCPKCGRETQFKDYEVPRSSCKKEYGILDTYYFGVNEGIRNLLIDNFEDITEADFRPVRNKAGDIVYYQIIPQYVMLPISSVNAWKPLKACPLCSSLEYKEEKEFRNENDEKYLFITPEALKDIKSINRTYEELGLFHPEYIVSREVYDFLSEKYPRMQFNPMFLKDPSTD